MSMDAITLREFPCPIAMLIEQSLLVASFAHRDGPTSWPEIQGSMAFQMRRVKRATIQSSCRNQSIGCPNSILQD
jgi:hypothetical protein